MKKKELQLKITEIVEKLGDTWQGTKADFMKFVSKNKRTIKKAAVTGSVFALSALMTACSMGVEKTDGKFGLYFDIGGKEKTSQSATQAPEETANQNDGISGMPNGNGGLVFGGDGQDWDNSTTTGGDNYNDYTTGGNDYDNNFGGTTPTNPTTNPTNPTMPDDWYNGGVHFGGDNDGTSYDTTSPISPIDPTNPTENIEPINPTNPTSPTESVEPTIPSDTASPTDPTNPTENVVPSDPTNPTNPSVSADRTPMDELLSALMGENVKVTSVKVTLDSNGDVAVWNMENGMSGQCVELKCAFVLCDENGDPIASGDGSTYSYSLFVSREAYNIASGGNSLPEITGDEIAHVFGEGFVEYVAGEYGVALPTNYGKDGM